MSCWYGGSTLMYGRVQAEKVVNITRAYLGTPVFVLGLQLYDSTYDMVYVFLAIEYRKSISCTVNTRKKC